MNTFKHSGDIGDILYSLPAVKTLGGGILYLDVAGGEKEPACNYQCIDKKTKFNINGFNFLKPLIEYQDYIQSVEIYNGQKIDYNLDLFRFTMNQQAPNSRPKNLTELHMETFKLPEWDHNTAWLKAGDPIKLGKPTLVARSPRMQSNHSWYQINKFNFRDKAIFIGSKKEHDLFEWTFDIKMEHVDSNNSLEIARYLLGCKSFVANSTGILGIAIGLGVVPIVQEVDPRCPASVFSNKKNMNYV
jgi:hypothetical protein